MLNQYDKAKAKLLYRLVYGSARKASDTMLASLAESVVTGAMPSDLLQKLLAQCRAARSLVATEKERKAIDGAIADLLDGIWDTDEVPQSHADRVKRRAIFAGS